MKLRRESEKPLVSVILPAYNAEKYLFLAVKSLLRQTLTNFELLIIDDASTDGTWKILCQLAAADARIRLFRNQKHQGLAKSLNFLLPKTRGQYVARMDADDIALPNRLEWQTKFLQENPQIIACGGQVEVIDEKGKHLAEKNFPLDFASCAQKILHYMVIQPSALMARGKIIRRLRYDNSLFGNDDISMHFKLLAKGRLANLPQKILKYRKLPSSLTHQNPRRVYFLALRVRLNAFLRGLYHPSFFQLFLLAGETFLVALLPSPLLLFLFETLRYAKKGEKGQKENKSYNLPKPRYWAKKWPWPSLLPLN